jgi:hypothetical protein
MIQLSQSALQLLDFTEACLLQGLCTPQKYLRACKAIWETDFKMQKQFIKKQEVKYDR